MQTKTHSFIETVTNVGIGYFIAIGSQMIIFPIYGIETNLTENMTIALWFTIISIIRSYIVRRFFTKRTEGVDNSS